ncbi:hypothetical protein [Halobaculum rubrum]|uniref:hypothetical protein n=1 Tax=Halobaculum rubrum TaxID=2872158 RepID=UPI001CA4264B|nr:hypothetical protein [Halobaculum rubrum]QZX99387.1 hypothetical protein K6T25_14225 [Halobaculum rubrum]
MAKQLKSLNQQFNRADQETKREIGEYVHQNPGRWIPKEELVEVAGIDESGVSRHIESLHEEEYVLSKMDDGQRHVQWNGRGAGGLEYWIRQIIPPQVRAASSELRPLLTLETLGGAYLPTILFGVFVILGLLCGVFAVIISFTPSGSLFGFNAKQIVFLAGSSTIFAAAFFVAIPIAKLIDAGVGRIWNIMTGEPESDGQEE